MNFGLILVCLLALVAAGCAHRGSGSSSARQPGKYDYTPPWKQKKAAEASPAPVPQLPPREQKLADLLRDYREGKISSRQYQEERAKVFSEK